MHMRLLSILSFLALIHASTIKITRIPPSNPPPQPRLYGCMGYASSSNSLIYFAGVETSTRAYNDIWQFQLDGNLWEILETTSVDYPGNCLRRWENESRLFC